MIRRDVLRAGADQTIKYYLIAGAFALTLGAVAEFAGREDVAQRATPADTTTVVETASLDT